MILNFFKRRFLLAKAKLMCYNHLAIKKWPCGQAVKTEPSQGSIPGSIPGRVTNKKEQTYVCSFSLCPCRLREARAIRPAVGGTKYSRAGPLPLLVISSTRHSAKVILHLQLFRKYAIIDYTINSY